jgi:4-hydroxybenzoyl-CoA thioesterase
MVFEQEVKVLFRHCDPAGIIFYPRYFEMVNDLVEAFFDEALGWPFETLLATAGVPTAEIRLRFTAPSRHGDRLQLRLEVTRLGRASMGLTFTAHSGAEQRFEGESTLVHVDGTGRPAPWPVMIREKVMAEKDQAR